MHVYLARHGQTNYNELGLCNADPTVNVYLSEIGIEQAKKLAKNMRAVKIDAIFVSQLQRTQQTAEYINIYHNLTVEIDSRLNDNRTGFEGKPAADYYAALESATNKWAARLNDGESLEDTKKRVIDFIDDLKTKRFDYVLVVTSMSIAQAFYGYVNNLTDEQAWEFQVDKGSCIEFDI